MTNKPFDINAIVGPTLNEESDLLEWLGRVASNVRYVGTPSDWKVEFTYNGIETSATGTSMAEAAAEALTYISANTPPLEEMQVYHLSQNVNQSKYAYSACIVIAPSRQAARLTHPQANSVTWNGKEWVYTYASAIHKGNRRSKEGKVVSNSWANPSQVTVTCIGIAAPGLPPQVVCTFQNYQS